MVDNISEKVRKSERRIIAEETVETQNENPPPINVVSTYGSDDEIVSTLKEYEHELTNTKLLETKIVYLNSLKELLVSYEIKLLPTKH